MNLDQAIAAHGAWKQKLSDYLAKRDGSLKASEAGADNKCPLGQWIYGEGAAFAKFPEFSKVKAEHARFHKAVGNVISRADAGQSVTEDVALGAHSEFGEASSSVVLALMDLKRHTSK